MNMESKFLWKVITTSCFCNNCDMLIVLCHNITLIMFYVPYECTTVQLLSIKAKSIKNKLTSSSADSKLEAVMVSQFLDCREFLAF